MAAAAAPPELESRSLDPRAPAPLPRKRWAIVAGLLLTEYLALSFFYDARPLASTFGFLSGAGGLGPLVVAVASALYAFGHVPPPAAHEIAAACWPLPRFRTLGSLHAVAVLAFFVVSDGVLGADEPPPALWVGLWGASALAVVISAVGLAVPWRAWRPIMRLSARPVLIGVGVGGAAFAAGLASEWFWTPLATTTLHVTAAVLETIGVQGVIVNPAVRQLGLGNFVVEVAPVCSGAQGLGLTGVFIGAYLVKFRQSLRFPRAFVLLPVGLVAAYLVNILRLAALMLVGAYVSEDVAFGGFHSKAGWVLNVALALVLLVWVRRSRFFARERPEGQVADAGLDENPTAAYLTPLLVSVTLALLTGLATTDFDRFYWVRIVGAALALFLVRRGLSATGSWTWSWSVTPVVLGIGVLIVWLALARRADPDEVADFRAALAGMNPGLRWAWLGTRVAGAVLMAVIEEIGFRGFLLRRLVSAEFWDVEYRAAGRQMFAVVVSSLAFGALHGGALVAGTLAGVAYAAATAVRGRLTDAIVAHAVTNGLLVVYAVGFNHWEWLA
jgi:exosortase E/protease (VPEID-CTERM system)